MILEGLELSMSDQTPYLPLPPYDASLNRGVIYVDELGPDGTSIQLLLYPIPAEALPLVGPTQVFGISGKELWDASPDVQYSVMRAWFRLNHQPAPPDVMRRFTARNVYSPRAQLETHFSGWGTEGLNESGERLVREILSEARVWLQKPPEQLEILRRSALRTLDELEAIIQQGRSGFPDRDHNHPPELVTDNLATLDKGYLNALVDTRRELRAERPNIEVLRTGAQTIFKWARIASAIVGPTARVSWSAIRLPAAMVGIYITKDAYDNGPDAAIARVVALAHKASEAAMTIQGFIAGL